MENTLKKLSYKRTSIYNTNTFEVVLCEWTNKSISDFHNHGGNYCFVYILEGEFQNSDKIGRKIKKVIIKEGEYIVTPVGIKHKFQCLSKKGKSLHFYINYKNKVLSI